MGLSRNLSYAMKSDDSDPHRRLGTSSSRRVPAVAAYTQEGRGTGGGHQEATRRAWITILGRRLRI